MKKMAGLLLFLVTACISFGVTTQTRQVKGIATTREQAIKKALHEAVGQVQGVWVGSGVADSAVGVGTTCNSSPITLQVATCGLTRNTAPKVGP